MEHRTALISAILAFGLVSVGSADMVAVDNGIAVKPADVATPARGMTMNQVTSKFGAPVNKVAAVGNPPISRWDYTGFVVYFERDYVIHTVATTSSEVAPPPAS
jgi:outer membrane protein assembly factor BamE (lipoprotein component of BamABCDE complex)